VSLHKSLKQKNLLARQRNVLTRAERVERLKEDERWEEGQDSVFGLLKVKPRVVSIAAAHAIKEEEEEQEELEAAEAEGEGAEPAEGK